MAHEYRTSRRIEFVDTDAAGIAHFSWFYVAMEQAEHEFLRSLGLSVHMEVDGDLVSWPRLAASCEFFRPVKFEDEVDIHLVVRRKGSKSATFGCEFSHEGERVAAGEIITACCVCNPGQEIRAIPIPAVYDDLEQAPDQEE